MTRQPREESLFCNYLVGTARLWLDSPESSLSSTEQVPATLFFHFNFSSPPHGSFQFSTSLLNLEGQNCFRFNIHQAEQDNPASLHLLATLPPMLPGTHLPSLQPGHAAGQVMQSCISSSQIPAGTLNPYARLHVHFG